MTLKEYENKINGLKAERDLERAELEQAVEAAEKAQKEALAQATAAYTAASVTTYHEAQEAARTAGDAATMYRDKLKSLEESPIVSKDEFEDMKTGIFGVISSELDSERQSIKKLIDKMGECADRAQKTIEKANELLSVLQHDLAFDDACLETVQGRRVHFDHLECRWRDFSLLEYVREQKAHPVYSKEVKNETRF